MLKDLVIGIYLQLNNYFTGQKGDNLDTDKQSVRHFYIARGSTAELRTQLIISLEIGYITSQEFELFDTECDKISAMLTTLIKHRMK